VRADIAPVVGVAPAQVGAQGAGRPGPTSKSVFPSRRQPQTTTSSAARRTAILQGSRGSPAPVLPDLPSVRDGRTLTNRMKHLDVLSNAELVATPPSWAGEVALPQPDAEPVDPRPVDPRPVDRHLRRAPGAGATGNQQEVGGSVMRALQFRPIPCTCNTPEAGFRDLREHCFRARAHAGRANFAKAWRRETGGISLHQYRRRRSRPPTSCPARLAWTCPS
jgi:hypothetical protein